MQNLRIVIGLIIAYLQFILGLQQQQQQQQQQQLQERNDDNDDGYCSE